MRVVTDVNLWRE